MVIGGDFDSVEKDSIIFTRKNLVFLDSSFNILPYQLIKSMNGVINKVNFDPITNYLWIGGSFSSVTDINGSVYSCNNVIIFDINSPNISVVNYNINTDLAVYDINFTSQKAIIVGQFTTVKNGLSTRNGIAAFNRFNGKIF